MRGARPERRRRRGRVRRTSRRARGRARPAGADLPDARRVAERDRASAGRARRALPVPVSRLERGSRAIQNKRTQLEAAAEAAGVGMSADRAPALGGRGAGGRDGARLPGAREARRPDRVQAPPSGGRRSAARPRPSSRPRTRRRRRTSRWCRSSIPGGDDALYTLGSYLDASREAARRVQRPQAPADAAARGHVPRRRGALGAGGRRTRGFACSPRSATAGSRRWSSSAIRATARFKLMEINPRLFQSARAGCRVRRRPPAPRVRRQPARAREPAERR